MLDLVCINEVIEIVAETCGNEYNASGGCVNDGQCQESALLVIYSKASVKFYTALIHSQRLDTKRG